MVVSADHKSQRLPNGKIALHPAVGSCNLHPAPVNVMLLWQGAISRQIKTSPVEVGIGTRDQAEVMRELVLHELAHLFGVDDSDSLVNVEGTGLSTMNVPVGPEMGDGVAGFHLSEYRQVRQFVDPLPQS